MVHGLGFSTPDYGSNFSSRNPSCHPFIRSSHFYRVSRRDAIVVSDRERLPSSRSRSGSPLSFVVPGLRDRRSRSSSPFGLDYLTGSHSGTNFRKGRCLLRSLRSRESACEESIRSFVTLFSSKIAGYQNTLPNDPPCGS
jgi:hypothetical protein